MVRVLVDPRRVGVEFGVAAGERAVDYAVHVGQRLKPLDPPDRLADFDGVAGLGLEPVLDDLAEHSGGKPGEPDAVKGPGGGGTARAGRLDLFEPEVRPGVQAALRQPALE